MLIPMGGSDHIAIPKGGGKDMQELRARLTSTGTWDMASSSTIYAKRDPQTAIEWSSYSGIYDQFKVNGMRLSLAFPKNAPTGFVASGVVGSNFSIWPNSVVLCYDNDSIVVPSSLSQAFGYSTAMVESPFGLVSYSLPTLPVGAAYGDLTGYINSAEWSDVASPGALSGIASGYLDQNPLSLAPDSGLTTVSVLVEWDVTFRGKRN